MLEFLKIPPDKLKGKLVAIIPPITFLIVTTTYIAN